MQVFQDGEVFGISGVGRREATTLPRDFPEFLCCTSYHGSVTAFPAVLFLGAAYRLNRCLFLVEAFKLQVSGVFLCYGSIDLKQMT
jgi:hypothetical protein